MDFRGVLWDFLTVTRPICFISIKRLRMVARLVNEDSTRRRSAFNCFIGFLNYVVVRVFRLTIRRGRVVPFGVPIRATGINMVCLRVYWWLLREYCCIIRSQFIRLSMVWYFRGLFCLVYLCCFSFSCYGSGTGVRTYRASGFCLYVSEVCGLWGFSE